MAERISQFTITLHATREMEQRGIDKSVVDQVLSAPEQREIVREGREVLQSRVSFPDGAFIVRVFVDINRSPAEVVTVYRTSKTKKYWRDEL